MSGQNYEKNTDRKEKICDSFQKYQIFSRQYEEEWNELFKTQEINIAVLKQKSVEEKLRSSHFRSICWRVLLGILHSQPAQWLFQLQTYRKHYNEICTELDNNPWNINSDISFDNPLSQESEVSLNSWVKNFYYSLTAKLFL